MRAPFWSHMDKCIKWKANTYRKKHNERYDLHIYNKNNNADDKNTLMIKEAWVAHWCKNFGYMITWLSCIVMGLNPEYYSIWQILKLYTDMTLAVDKNTKPQFLTCVAIEKTKHNKVVGRRRFIHYTIHITVGRFVGRGNQYIQLVKVLYCKLLTIGKQLPTFPHKVRGLNRQPQRWEASVLPLRQRGPFQFIQICMKIMFYFHIWNMAFKTLWACHDG